jgi:hypothetical protein
MKKLGRVPARKATSASPAVGGAYKDFTYNGGPIVEWPRIQVTFLGQLWSDATHQIQAARLVQFLKDMLASDWMNILAQYGVGTGKGSGQFLGESYVSNVSGNVSDDNIRATIAGQIAAGSIPKPDRNQVVIAFLDETIAVADAQIRMCEQNGDTAFGYHNFFAIADGSPCYYAVIPSLDDNCIRNNPQYMPERMFLAN